MKSTAKSVWQDVCFQTARCEMLGFSRRNPKKISTTNLPSTTVLWFSLISLKLSLLTPAGVNRFVCVHFLRFLQFKVKWVPSQGFAWIKFPENERNKMKSFLIGYPEHPRHTAGQKTGQLKIARCRRENIRFPADHLTSRNRKQALRKSRLATWTWNSTGSASQWNSSSKNCREHVNKI